MNNFYLTFHPFLDLKELLQAMLLTCFIKVNCCVFVVSNAMFSPGLSTECHDGLIWMVSLTVEIKLRTRF